MKVWGLRAAGIFFLVSAILAASRPIRSFDPWWHLATGKWIFTHHAVPRVDPFSFTRLGKPWIDLAWLFQIIEFDIYKASGFYGLVVFKVTVALLIFYFLYKLIVLYTRNSYLVSGLLFLALGIAQIRFMVRPHLLAFLWVVLFLYLFHSYITGGRLWQLLTLAAVYILWVNTHGSFIVGPFLIGAFLLGALGERWNWEVKAILADSVVKRMGVCLLVVALASLCNPYGFKYITFAIFSHRGIGSQATKYIAEWHKMSPYSFFVLSPFSKVGLVAFLFWTAFLLIGINAFQRRIGVLAHALIFAIMLYLSLKHGRFVALASLVLVPSIACLYSWCQSSLYPGFRGVFAVLVLVLPAIFLAFKLLPARINDEELGRAVSRNYPHGVVKFIDEKGLRGDMFNKYGYGGFLIWYLYPRCRVFIDGRTPTVYPADFYWLYRMVYKDEKLFQELAHQYNITMVIEKTDSTIAKYLDKNKNWDLVFFDEVTSLYVKDEVAKQKDLKLVKYYKPWMDMEKLLDKYKKDKKALLAMEGEIKGVLSLYPVNLKATTDLGILLSEGLKEYGSAMEILKKALDLDPRSPNAWYNLGLVYKKLKKMDKARDCFLKSVSFKKKFGPALYQLGMLSYREGRYRDTHRYLQRYVSVTGDRTPPDVYERLGMACFKLIKLDEARRNFKKALYLTHDPGKKAKIYVNLGNCYFARGEWKEAEKNYLKAVHLDPRNRDACYNLAETYRKMGKKAKALKWRKRYEELATASKGALENQAP